MTTVHTMRRNGKFTILSLLAVFAFFVTQNGAFAGVEEKFKTHSSASQVQVDHSVWDGLLKKYVKESSDGVNRVNYKAFKANGAKELKTYLAHLQGTDVTKLNRNEQFAFWVNLYNAMTIEVILDHYPTASIRDIDISPGLFADGPWGKKLMRVNGTELSLDDIEHKILRGLWKDPRIHYAVNCASIGCPNLARDAYTSANLEEMLNTNGKKFVGSQRGVKVVKGRITVSSIYKWFRKDFGTSEDRILAHIRKFASPELKAKLKGQDDIYTYAYDWSLNDLTR